MAADVSKKTVVALLLVAIALSVAGTWIALTTEPVPTITGPGVNSESGKVQLEIEPLPKMESGEGRVSLIIKK